MRETSVLHDHRQSLKEFVLDCFSHLPQEFAVIRSNLDLDRDVCFLALSTELYISLPFTLTLNVNKHSFHQLPRLLIRLSYSR